ncbi:hypothetical protein LTR28_005094, partial [Elasticomyces elasticus]
IFKDLQAHMLTYQTEGPGKCSIVTCEYHIKGFARKYDQTRHADTLQRLDDLSVLSRHRAAERIFNRADVFKRHLTSVHGVEQTPPTSRKNAPISNKLHLGKAAAYTARPCPTRGKRFSNPQEFYEHLDDCVLKLIHIGS